MGVEEKGEMKLRLMLSFCQILGLCYRAFPAAFTFMFLVSVVICNVLIGDFR